MNSAEAVALAADVIARDRSAANLADTDGWSNWEAGRKYSEALDGVRTYAFSDRLVICHIPDVWGGSWGYVAGEILDNASGSLFTSPYQTPEDADIIQLDNRTYALSW
jgi:hypothetical protein